jgi:hypothetical protein
MRSDGRGQGITQENRRAGAGKAEAPVRTREREQRVITRVAPGGHSHVEVTRTEFAPDAV